MNIFFTFNNSEEIIQYIKNEGKQVFKFTKGYENLITTHRWIDDSEITLHWKGEKDYIHSHQEMVSLYEKGEIQLIEERIKISCKPFAKMKKRKLTESEYKRLEFPEHLTPVLFEDIMKQNEMEKKFEEYLKKRESEQ